MFGLVVLWKGIKFLTVLNGCNCRRRCRKYHLQGEKRGSVENFIDNLPGTPDNIRYDGEGHYWIALATVIHFLYLLDKESIVIWTPWNASCILLECKQHALFLKNCFDYCSAMNKIRKHSALTFFGVLNWQEITPSWNLAFRYPFIRKGLAIMEKYTAGRPNMEKNAGVMAVNMEGEPIAHYSDPKLTLISSGSKIGKYLYCGSIIYPYIIRFDLEQHPAHSTTWASSTTKDHPWCTDSCSFWCIILNTNKLATHLVFLCLYMKHQ